MTSDAEFRTRVVGEFGVRGEEWLSTLPALLNDLSLSWKVSLGDPLRDLSVNYLCECTTSDGDRCVVKVGVPHDDLKTEIEALRHYDGRGIVRVLRVYPDRHAMLLEKVQPATMLFELKDNKRETRVAAKVMRNLLRPAPSGHTLPDLMGKVRRKLTAARAKLEVSHEFPVEWIDMAEDALHRCTSIDQSDCLLHGDLHHGNIVYDDERGWIAIDPKGFVGPSQLEVGRFSFNFLPVPIEESSAPFRERLSILSQELEDDQVHRWAMVDIVQCLASTIDEEDSDWKTFLMKSAEVASRLLD